MVKRIYAEVIEPMLRGAPVSPEHLNVLAKSYEGLFGVAPEHAWAQVLVQEIAEAKRAKLAQKAAEATQVRPANVQADDAWSIMLHATKSGLVKYPGLQKPTRIPVSPVWIYKNTRDGLIALWGEVETGKPQLLLFVTVAFGDWDPPEPYADETIWANNVLVQAIQKLAQLNCGMLPEYILDDQLVTWLIDRMGFEGGGGPDHVSEATLVKWLLSPERLGEELEKYGRRTAETQHDDEASETVGKFCSLAERVRVGIESRRP